MDNTTHYFRSLAAVGFVFALYACAVTTDATKSSSQTFQNTTEASSKFTSSTSPGADSSSSKAERTLAFSRVKLERIRTDMAVGGGEHLASLATLLGVPARNQQRFFALAKAHFSTLFSSEQTTAEQMLARLEHELSANPGLLQ